jgi:hypothetical protein
MNKNAFTAIALTMEAASTSETSVNFYHTATTQVTAIFILAVVRT